LHIEGAGGDGECVGRGVMGWLGAPQHVEYGEVTPPKKKKIAERSPPPQHNNTPTKKKQKKLKSELTTKKTNTPALPHSQRGRLVLRWWRMGKMPKVLGDIMV